MPHHHRLNPETIRRSRDLRRHATHPEQILWSAIRGRKLAGMKFRRQHAIGHYIVDFCCVEAFLVIEVDGRSHDDRITADAERQAVIEAAGYRVVRVSNDDVLSNLEGVAEMIANNARDSHS